ncbi:MAG TPA: PAS domain S-box protein [bacterium]
MGALRQEHLALVLTNDAQTAELIEHQLRQVGIALNVRWVETAEAFRRALAQSAPMLVLSDDATSGLNGLEAHALTREHHPDVPFVCVHSVPGGAGTVRVPPGTTLTEYVLNTQLEQLVPSVRRLLREAALASGRAQARTALETAETRFEELANAIPEVCYSCTPDYRKFFFVNRAYELIWGRSRESLILAPQSQLELVHPEDRGRVREARAHILDGLPLSVEYRIVRVDGEVRWIHDRAVPVRDADGLVARAAGIAADITERKAIERALIESQKQNAMLVDEAPDPIITLSPDGRVRSVNKVVEHILGRPASEVLNQPFQALGVLTPHSLLTASEEFAFALAGVTRPPYELTFVVGGRALVYEVNPRLLTREGRLDRIQVVLRDMTARHRAEQERDRSEERYHSLVSASAAIVWSTDAEGRASGEAPGWQAYTGQAPEAAREFGWLAMYHEDDRDAMMATWREAVRRRAIMETEMRIWHQPTGAYRHVLVRGVPLLQPDGTLREWVGMISDIHDRKTAEQALLVSHRELEVQNRGMLSREDRVVELKREINALLREMGRPEQYAE